MGHKHSKDAILEGALACAFADGLSQLTFGRVARHLEISDRIVVYYFPTKDDLIGEVMGSVGAQLQVALGDAFGRPAADHMALVRLAWPVLATPTADPVFALFFEATGLAAAGREPYATLVPQLVEAWTAWVAEFLEVAPARRMAEAEAVVAMVDGLLLFRQLAGPDAAQRAAEVLGVA